MSILASDVSRRAETCRVLNLLARGIHPVDGSALSDEGCWNHPVVIRALLFAGDYLSESKTVDSLLDKKASVDGFTRCGKPWSQYEDSELRKGFENLETLQQLSNRHKRSRGAIIARIAHIGLVADRNEARKVLSSRSHRVEVDMINEES